MNKLIAAINELETKIPLSDKLDTAVSKSTVGWHIHHSLLVGLQIIQAVEKSDPENYKWKFNLKKTLVYTLNKVPRGRAKAPERVVPTEIFSVEVMKQHFDLLRSRLPVLETLPANSFFKHPFFGNLNIKDTIKMLRLHTLHHVSIINDIVGGKAN